MSATVFPAPAPVLLPVQGEEAFFPVHRIYCVGRNFAEHAKEMGAVVERGTPVIFMKPADAVVSDGDVRYPPGTSDLHHEVELVVALGRDAQGVITNEQAMSYVFGYAVGLDLTRRDLQAIAKDKRWPWDVSKGFDHSAPIGPLLRAEAAGDLSRSALELTVNGQLRQQAPLSDMIFSVADILAYLSGLFELRAGDLIYMGTPSGVAALQRGDAFHARIDGLPELHGHLR